MAAAGSDAAAATLLSQALAEYARIFPAETTTVIGAQILEKWVPTLPEVRCLHLTDEQARAHHKQCGRLLYVHSFRTVTPEVVAVAVAAGNRCMVSGLDFQIRLLESGWQLEIGRLETVPGGFVRRLPGGFTSGGAHCGCG